jgi:hypothetical protein
MRHRFLIVEAKAFLPPNAVNRREVHRGTKKRVHPTKAVAGVLLRHLEHFRLEFGPALLALPSASVPGEPDHLRRETSLSSRFPSAFLLAAGLTVFPPPPLVRAELESLAGTIPLSRAFSASSPLSSSDGMPPYLYRQR